MTPSNVILTPAGEVKLLDFGVATFKDALQGTKSGTVKGKPAYLAPEQLEGKPIDGRVDLFALGIVMHEMLTLQHLFAGDSDLGTVKQIMEMEIPQSVGATQRRAGGAGADRDARAGARPRASGSRRRRRWRAALDDFVVASKLHVDEVVTLRARDRRGGGAAAAGAGQAGRRARRPTRARATLRGRQRAGATAPVRVAGAAAPSRARPTASRTRAVVALGVALRDARRRNGGRPSRATSPAARTRPRRSRGRRRRAAGAAPNRPDRSRRARDAARRARSRAPVARSASVAALS